jgi:hypothetical protein
VYIAIAEALESMDVIEDLLSSEVKVPTPLYIFQIRKVAARTLGPPSFDDAYTLASQLVKGHALVEVPGLWSRDGDNPRIPSPCQNQDLFPITPWLHASMRAV